MSFYCQSSIYTHTSPLFEVCASAYYRKFVADLSADISFPIVENIVTVYPPENRGKKMLWDFDFFYII